MPTYQYACTECGHRFEAVQSFSDDALTECPRCTGRLRKVFSSVGVVFKGSGFYRTDSRDKPKESTGTGTKEPPSSGASTTSDSGPKSDSSSSASSTSSTSSTSSSSKAGSAA